MKNRIYLINFYRWIKEFFIAWGILGFFYSISATLFFQSLIHFFLEWDLPAWQVWMSLCGFVLLAGVIENLPFPPVSLFLPLKPNNLAGMYMLHDLRRGSTWVVVLFTVYASTWVHVDKKVLVWMILMQLPVQRAMFSIYKWRAHALHYFPKRAALMLITGMWFSQAVQFLVGFLLMMAFNSSVDLSFEGWMTFGIATLIGVWVGSSFLFEGDAGSPGLVNFITLSIGTFASLVSYQYTAWAALLLGYFVYSYLGIIPRRLRSVEYLDEDLIIS